MTTKKQENHYLRQCRKLIEEELQWADSVHWRHQEFILLSDKIFDKTGVSLSPNTLKRLWGKVSYEHKPNASTLNALANFLGFENWVEFIASRELDESVDSEISRESNLAETHLLPIDNSLMIESFFTIGLIGLIAIITLQWRQQFVSNFDRTLVDQVEFVSEKVAGGVPNTVIFHYDVKDLEAGAFFIQQNWDARRRFQIDPNKKEATSTYYYPGYWRAKILADSNILKEHDLIIESSGWLLTLDDDPSPRYFLPEEQEKDAELTIKDEVYAESIRGMPELPWLTAHYVDDFGSLNMDNLQMELKIKNDYRSGLAACQNIRIVVLGSEGVFSIPFSNPGCIGDLRLRFSDLVKDGKDNNLSAFGRDMDFWQRIRISVLNKNVQIFIDDTLIETLTYRESAGDFYGLRIKFQGLGEISSVCVKNAEGDISYQLWPQQVQ